MRGRIKNLIDFIKRGEYDEIYTPKVAVLPLIKYIPPDWTIWECTDYGTSNISWIFRNKGYKVIDYSLKDGFDFLKDGMQKHYDIIITNPPYSLKDAFLKRAYDIGKPFCFLLPITALEGVRRGSLYRKYGIELLVLDRRINFTGGGGSWFNVSWFCWKVLPEKLLFVDCKNVL